MRKMFLMPCMLFLLSACGTVEEPLGDQELIDNPGGSTASGQDDAKKAQDRKILIALQQTAEPVKRNEAAAAIKQTPDFKEGFLGEPTEELAQDMAVHQIEAAAVDKAIEKIYGGHKEFEKAGIYFFENKQTGAKQPGIWLGIKNPDARVDELAAILQKQVDSGEILAEPIYIFESAHTRADLDNLMYQASKKLKPMVDAQPNPDALTYSISADTITGVLEIGHNFLTENQIQELVQSFPEQEVHIQQEGMMVPAPGEPTVKYPEPAVTQEFSDEGSYIISLEQDRFLAIEASAKDFSGTGGQEEFYPAIYFEFKDAAELLKIGQRVNVEAAGPILESYPGQGSAVFVEVLPSYQPESAELSEEVVVKRALQSLDAEVFNFPAIRSVTYQEKEGKWTISFASEDRKTEKTVEDKK